MRWYQGTLLFWAIVYLLGTYLIKAGFVGADAAGVTVALVPSLVAIVPAMAFFRFIREADELQRLIQLQALALGVGAGFIVFPCVELLERLGFVVTAWDDVVPLVVLATYTVTLFLGLRRYR